MKKLKLKYRLGDRFSNDFDYDGMVEMGLKTNSTWSISDLQKLYDSMEDVNYHTANKYLGQAIVALENDMPEIADIKFEKFHKELDINYIDINYIDRTAEIEELYIPTLIDIKQDPEMYAELVNDLLFHWIYGTRETPLMNMVKSKMVGKMADGIIGSSDGITFSTRNENLAHNLAKAFSDIGYDTKVVSIGGGENYVVWVKKTYADGGMMEDGGLVITSSYYDENNEELQLYVDDAIYCTISFDHNPSDDEVDEIISDIEWEHNNK